MSKIIQQTMAANDRSHNGSAIIIVLIALSIVLPIGVGYSFFIFASRDSAAIYLNKIRARGFCESGLNHAIAVIRARYDPVDGNGDSDDRFPATSPNRSFYSPATGDYSGRDYLFSASADNGDIADKLSMTMSGANFLPNTVLDVDSPVTPVADDRGFLPIVVENEVIGRFAFAIINDSGKLDPNTIAPYYGADSEATGSVVRDGISDSEVCLADAGIADFDDYKFANDKRWHSLRQIARALNPADFDSAVIRRLHPYSYHEETYWNDNNDDDIYSVDEVYVRLDLSDVTETTVAKLYKAFIAPDDSDETLPDIGDVNDANDCRWLKQLSDDAVIADGAERRRIAAQIAVNIRDYSDADDDITIAWIKNSGEITLTDPGTALTETKIYGRENQYGVSELSARLATSVIDSGGSSKDLRADVYFRGEIYFPGTENADLNAHTLTVTYTVRIDSDTSSETAFFNGSASTILLDSTINEDGGTLWYSSGWDLAGTHTETNFIGNIPVVNNKYQITDFQIDSLVLSDGNQDIDSHPSQPANSMWWDWSSAALQMGDKNYYATLEAFDPQNNDRDEAGPFYSFNNTWAASPDGSANLLISASAVDIGGLTELSGTSSLSNYSDIVVKNAAIERIGELGRLGSYWPGRSLRFWAADSSDVVGIDAHILDLFKIGGEDTGTGRVNINSNQSNVLTALLTATTSVAVTGAVNAILTERASKTFSNIGDFYRIAGLSGTDKTQDAAEEQLIVQTAELITVRPNYFTVVVTAQSIQDYGDQYFYKDLNNDGDTYDPGETIATTLGVYDHNGDEILATSQLLAVLYRDTFTNQVKITHIEYLDY